MRGFRGEMLRTAEETLVKSRGDPFEVFPALMSRIFEMSEQFYNPELFRNLYSCVSAKRMQSFEFFRLDTGEILARFGHMIRNTPFDGLASETKRDIIDILIVLLHSSIERCYSENIPVDASLEEYRRKINIIKNCVLLKGAV